MSKFTVYDTLCLADIQALQECATVVEVSFDASHEGSVKPVHLEIYVQIDHDQIGRLQLKRHEAATKFRLGVLHRGGAYKFECLHFDDDIVRASQQEYDIRSNRASVRWGGKGGMVSDVGVWKL